MLEFLKGPFLVLNFSYYKLMTFWMMQFVKLLYILILLRVSHSGGIGGGVPPIQQFFPNSPIKSDAPLGALPPPLKNEASPIWKTIPHWNMKHPSMKLFLEKAQ